MMIIPTRNNTIPAIPLHAIKLNKDLILAIKAIEEMLSKRKNTPISATSQSKLILGTRSNNIPIARINAPKKIDQIIFDM